MPNDTYTLTIADAGVTTPSAHADTHITGGSDAIQSATTSQNGLMTSAQVTSLASAANFANGTLNITSAKIVDNNVTLTKLATVPANSILANSESTTGNVSTITCTAAGRNLLDDADAAAQRATLGLGTLATQNANATSITGGTIAGANITLTGKTLTGGTLDGVTLTNITGGTVAPATHASTHVTGGSDAIQSATTSQNGLMTSAHVTSLESAANFANGTLNITSAKIVDNNVSLTKLATVPANSILANSGSATGNVSTITCTAAGRNLLDDADVAAQRTTLGLGTLAVQNANNVSITGGAIAGASINLAGKTLSGGTLDGVTLTNVIGGAVDLSSATGTLPVSNGGTGKALYAVGDILYAETTTNLASLAGAATGNALLSGGNATAPTYGKVGLGTHVSGTLPVGNGGTGATSFAAGFIKSNGTTLTSSSLPVSVADGGTGKSSFLSTGPLYYDALTEQIDVGVAGTLPIASGGTGATSLASGIVMSNGTSLSTTSLTSGIVKSNGTTLSTISGAIPITSGGTGATSFTSTGPLYYDSVAGTIDVNAAAGTLSIANGGTGATSLVAGFIKSNGTSLTSSASPISVADGGTGRNNFVTTNALITSGTSSTSAQQLLPNGNAGQFLRSQSASLPSWVDLSAGDITAGQLATSRGGTNLSSFNTNGALYATSSSTLATGTLPIASGGTGLSSLTANGTLFSNSSGTGFNCSTLPVASGGTGMTVFASGGAVYASGNTTLTSGTLPITAGGTGITSVTSNGAVYVNSGSALLTGTLPVLSGGTGQTASAEGLTVLTSDVAVSVSSVATFSVVPASGTAVSVSGMTNGTTNTLSLKNTTSATRDFRIGGSIELSVVAINIASITFNTTTVTVTTTGVHGIPTGRVPAFLSGFTFTSTGNLENYNGLNLVTITGTSTFTFPIANVTNVTVSSAQVLFGGTVAARFSVGASAALSALSSSEARGYFNPAAGTTGLVSIPLDYIVSLPANHEVVVFVTNYTSTNSLTVKRAKLMATALI